MASPSTLPARWGAGAQWAMAVAAAMPCNGIVTAINHSSKSRHQQTMAKCSGHGKSGRWRRCGACAGQYNDHTRACQIHAFSA